MIIATTMNLRRLVSIAALLLFAVTANAAKKEAPPLADIATYPMLEKHEKELVTIAADPYDTRARADFFRIDYVGHSILPVRIIIRNDSDHPLDLSAVRIQLEPKNGGKLPAALPEEIHRRVFHVKNPAQQKRLPFPTPSFSTPVDKKILQDDTDFSFRAATIAPHTTASGFLFYDIADLDDDYPLRGADLYFKMIKTSDGKGSTELFPFTLPFDKYLATKSSAPPSGGHVVKTDK